MSGGDTVSRQRLAAIWDCTVERWDADQAETYVLEIRSAIERIAEQPHRGRAVNDIRAGYRRYAIGSHLVFFVTGVDGIDIIRILHQRMDPMQYV